MSRRPLSPEVWEQALVNGRRIHPSDSKAATAWSEHWYREQGGRFNDDLEPVENTMTDEEFETLIAASDHGPGPFEPEAPFVQPAPVAPVPPKPPTRSRRRAHTDKGHFKSDDPATPAVNEAWQDNAD